MVPLLLVLAASPFPPSVAEASGFERTGRYDEVLRWCDALPRALPGRVRCERFGTTPLGRPMVALVAAEGGALTPERCAAQNRPVVAFIAGIHAGEIDGKDATYALLRALLTAKATKGPLSAITLVVVPVFNVDGHERFGPNHRPNQRGPAEMGWRVTSHNLNLNRDWAKAEAPEMAAMLGLLHRWNPVLLVDLHVTDGAKFEHDVSITFEPRFGGAEALRGHGEALKTSLFTTLEKQGHLPVDFYPSFEREDDPSTGFSQGWPPPRFANAYWAVNNRFGALVELHSWKPYPQRVAATLDVCRAFLAQAAAHGRQWLEAATAADVADSALPAEAAVTLTYKPGPTLRTIDFRGYAYTRERSDISGQPWVRYDESTPQVWKVPLVEGLSPALVLPKPGGGYLVPPPYADWAATKLKLHGLRFERVGSSLTGLALDVFHGTPTFRPEPLEGRHVVSVRGQWRPARLDIEAGALYVPTSQPKVALVMQLLEPTAPDSFTSWGYFNAHFEQKEYLEDYLTEAYARELLADAGVKAEFEQALADAGFANSPSERLAFFSRRHPSADPTWRRMPVYRLAAPLTQLRKRPSTSP